MNLIDTTITLQDFLPSKLEMEVTFRLPYSSVGDYTLYSKWTGVTYEKKYWFFGPLEEHPVYSPYIESIGQQLIRIPKTADNEPILAVIKEFEELTGRSVNVHLVTDFYRFDE